LEKLHKTVNVIIKKTLSKEGTWKPSRKMSHRNVTENYTIQEAKRNHSIRLLCTAVPVPIFGIIVANYDY
jgi:hypothetical protein